VETFEKCRFLQIDDKIFKNNRVFKNIFANLDVAPKQQHQPPL